MKLGKNCAVHRHMHPNWHKSRQHDAQKLLKYHIRISKHSVRMCATSVQYDMASQSKSPSYIVNNILIFNMRVKITEILEKKRVTKASITNA